jgi:hypothetical protein
MIKTRPITDEISSNIKPKFAIVVIFCNLFGFQLFYYTTNGIYEAKDQLSKWRYLQSCETRRSLS